MTVDQLATKIEDHERRLAELEGTAPVGARKSTIEPADPREKDFPKKETGTTKHDR